MIGVVYPFHHAGQLLWLIPKRPCECDNRGLINPMHNSVILPTLPALTPALGGRAGAAKVVCTRTARASHKDSATSATSFALTLVLIVATDLKLIRHLDKIADPTPTFTWHTH